jgi:PAS domain S-box-containing protein
VAALHLLLVESVIDYAIFVLDPRGHVLSWNRGAERLKGYAPREIIAKHFSVFYPPADVEARKPDRELEIAAREGRVEDEGWRVRKDGSRFWANVVITALRDTSGKLVGFAKVTRDLTARVAMEEERRKRAAAEAGRGVAEQRSEELQLLSERLQQQALELELQTQEAQSLTEELEESNEALQNALLEAEAARDEAHAARATAETANRAKSDFLATMSHELRTPLNAIGGYTELLEIGLHGPVTDAQATALRSIHRSQRHLLSLIEEILSFARIEAGRVAFDITDVGLGDLVADVESLMVPQVGAKGLVLDSSGCGSSHRAQGDPERIRQILLNLLSNAVKFTPSGGQITVTTAVNGAQAEVRIRDTGPGIPADKLESIFDPFVQVDRTFKSGREGAGLGLSISRGLATGMGGELRVESKVGSGSTFVLVLPRSAVATPAPGTS